MARILTQRTLLNMVQTAQQELGLPQAATVIGNSDLITNQMLGFIQADLEEIRLRNEKGWTQLQTEFNLVVNPPIIVNGDVTLDSPIITNVTTGISLLFDAFGNQVFDAFGAPIYTIGNAQSTIQPLYFMVAGAGIPAAARVLSVPGPNTIIMTMESTGTSVGTQLTFSQDTYPGPSDFDFYINRTWWDRTNRWELLGPDSPQLDQWHRSGIVTTGPRRHWRQIGPYGNYYRIWPPPAEITQPLQLVYEYYSTNAVLTHGGALTNPPTPTGSTFTFDFENDDDTCVLDSRALIMGIKWRFWEQKGFNWMSKRREWERRVDWLAATNGGSQTLNLVKRVNPIFISPANVQDGFFPGPVGST